MKKITATTYEGLDTITVCDSGVIPAPRDTNYIWVFAIEVPYERTTVNFYVHTGSLANYVKDDSVSSKEYDGRTDLFVRLYRVGYKAKFSMAVGRSSRLYVDIKKGFVIWSLSKIEED